jgi:ParB family chromosome partitioning protein
MAKQALPYSRTNLWLVDPNDILIIEDTDHPLYDLTRTTLPVDEAMVLNIMVYGVIEAINGRKNAEGKVEVIDGRRRVKAAREANRRLAAEGKELIRVPVVLKHGDPNRLYGVMISANEHRLDDTVLAKARKAARHFDMGATTEEVANSFGVSTTTLDNWQKLLLVKPALLEEVEKGNVSAHQAIKAVGNPKAQESLVKSAKAGTPLKRGRSQGSAAHPSKKAIKKVYDQLQKTAQVGPKKVLVPVMAMTLGWVLGVVSEEDFQKLVR